MGDLARWLSPLLLGAAWGSLWAAVVAGRQGSAEAVPILLGAAAVVACLAFPAIAIASRPRLRFFLGSSRRTSGVILMVVLAVGGPRLLLSREPVIDAMILVVVSVSLAAVAAAAVQHALRRETPDSPDGLDGDG